jgi:hypothetical protein
MVRLHSACIHPTHFFVPLSSDFFPEKPLLPHPHHSASQASPPFKPKRKARPRRRFQLRVPNIIVSAHMISSYSSLMYCNALHCTAPHLLSAASTLVLGHNGTYQKEKRKKSLCPCQTDRTGRSRPLATSFYTQSELRSRASDDFDYLVFPHHDPITTPSAFPLARLQGMFAGPQGHIFRPSRSGCLGTGPY